jgi:hypothetical protein
MQSHVVPLVLIEEHHEAFLVCQYAKHAGLIASGDNILLHVDEHSDMATPKLRTSPLNLHTAEEIKNFTYNELNIGNFICASVYARLFGEVYWMRRQHTFSKASKFATVSNTSSAGTKLSVKYHKLNDVVSGDRYAKSVQLHFLEPADAFHCDGPVVLDIDLDYFASNPYPLGPFDLEITASEYENFTRNPYHCLRLLFNGKITPHRESDRYFLKLCDPGQTAYGALHVRDIEERVDSFAEWLLVNKVRPSLIVICRSVHSGYTPRSTEPHLRSYLIQRLRTLFALSLHYVKDLTPDNVATPKHDSSFNMAGANLYEDVFHTSTATGNNEPA